ncbi:MAG TPA: hypothetical protein VN372_06960 [Methanospirillum sp.]|nr:hypothetical protein [Methanospirillum sp.]
MEKRDLIVIAIAIFIVLVMAIYIKPLVTGKEVKLIPDEISALFGAKKQTPADNNTSITNISLYDNNTSVRNITSVINATPNLTNTSKPEPTPPPSWNGSPVTIGLQDTGSAGAMYPRNYPASTNPIYSFSQASADLKNFSEISGQYSAKTNSFYIPSGYWEIWYTVDLKEDLQDAIITKKAATTKNTDGTKVVPEQTNSISIVNPQFEITVKNADSGSVVRTIIPPGGLNPSIWKGDFAKPGSLRNTTSSTSSSTSTSTTDTKKNWDPRPWKEKFFEGYRTYFLDITAQNLISYKVDIKVAGPNSSPLMNNTTSAPESIQSVGAEMEAAFKTYYQSVNGNISDPDTFRAIIGTLSQNILATASYDDIFRAITTMKFAGISFEGFSSTSSFYRGPEGSLKGDVSYQIGQIKRTMTLDIPFVQETTGWKMNQLVILRS